MLFYYLSSFFFFYFFIFLFLISLLYMYNDMIFFFEWMIMLLNSVEIMMYIYLDWMSLMFMSVVLLISSMIMIYSSEYMSHDNYINRFFYLVYLFIISMLLMIMSPNMISILLGWDGLGLISYCLVIYYNNYSSYNSGMLTVLMNRLGDVMIIMSISFMFINGSWNFMNYNYMYMIMLLMLMIACFTKSAQLPFSSWLPAAMAAPTPVSSLVHSSTLVTAGVYLLIRFNYIMFKNFFLMNFIMLIGLITMMMAGLSANFEFDLKKIIAFSTLSQLGLMMMIYSMNNYILTFFHLIIHALFKSLMFMCSGIIIHTMNNYQDIRYMGNLKFILPMTSMMLFISNLCLCGMPFFSGFYSKDQILEYMFIYNFSNIMYFYLLISTMLTLMYSFRLIYYLMNMNFNFMSNFMIKDYKFMNMPMMLLMLMSIFFGMFMNWIMFNNVEYIFLMFFEKVLVLLMCFISLFIVKKLFYMNLNLKFIYFLKFYLGKMWFLMNLNKLMIIFPLNLGLFMSLLFDKGWSEYFLKKMFVLKMLNLSWLNLIMNNYLMFLLLMLSNLFLMILLF
uniref:NADH-ubiquinone oxidoreductase chain 5 n=1 Tax=Pseudoligosita yasumatsui TaxID=3067466 RepID=A0AA49KED9_9HYME|nr:NADH dehydrogenase subunit 5 [Pseudoligosita yasumatsui]WLF85678.1 NADH dehydrogenase subunit 5 [Pseudoligosita yasumatsui]